MRRFAAVFAFVFLSSLVLAAYGHCWPMQQAQIGHENASQTHDHSGHLKPHRHPTDGFGQELSVPGVPSGPVAIIQAPVAKSYVPVLPAVAILDRGRADARARPHQNVRAGPPAFAEFHARTGRLLI